MKKVNAPIFFVWGKRNIKKVVLWGGTGSE